MATSHDFYNQLTERHEGNTSRLYGGGCEIAANGRFTYTMSGMSNGDFIRDQDDGVVELGGDLVIFKRRNHVVRYRFIHMQQALDGSTLLSLLPEYSQVNAGTIIIQ
jgi:hypothetical protein